MAKNIVSIFAQMEILQIEKNRPRTAAVHENQNSFIETTNTCINPFSMKRYYSTAFFRVFCCTLGACHTVNNSPIMLKSSLLDSASSQLSGEKNRINLSSLQAFLQLFKYCVQFFGQKTSKKMYALLKNQNQFSTYFLSEK